MSFKFRSKAAGDLVMLQADGQRLLHIIGKDAAPTGILLPEEMAAAVQALEQAIASDEAVRKRAPSAVAAGDPDPAPDVALRQRATPFIEMLGRCAKAGVEVVWGV